MKTSKKPKTVIEILNEELETHLMIDSTLRMIDEENNKYSFEESRREWSNNGFLGYKDK